MSILDFFKPKPKDTISKSDLATLISQSIPFGSRVWGGSTPKSDFDFVLPASYALGSAWKRVNQYLYDKSPWINFTFTYTYQGRVYQFCVPYSSDQSKVLTSIEIMNSLSKHYDVSNRKARHTTFEAIVDILSGIPNSSPIANEFISKHFPEYLI